MAPIIVPNKQALLTGATGNLGPHVLDLLLKENFQVRVATPDRPLIQHRSIEWIQADFMEEQTWTRLVADCDIVVHLAAELWNQAKMKRVNIAATAALAEAAEQSGVKVFCYTSSVGVYGFPPTHVITEATPTMRTDAEGDREYLAPKFLFEYARTKLLGEFEMLRCLRKTMGVIVRPTNIVNEINIKDVLEWGFWRRIWRGHRWTHQIYVKDVAAAIVFLCRRALSMGSGAADKVEIFNISNDDEATNRYFHVFRRSYEYTGKPFFGCPFWVPSFFDIWKDRVKFRRLSIGLPAGCVQYSPKKLLSTGFFYPHNIRRVQDRVLREI